MKTLLILVFLFYIVPFLVRRALEQRLQRAGAPIRITPDPFKNIMKNISIPSLRLRGRAPRTVLGALVALLVIFAMVRVVPAGMVGVVDVLGNVRAGALASGIHLVNPLARIIRMSVRTEEYTMSVTRGEGQRKDADAIRALTNEGLAVDLDITVFYHLRADKAADVYRDLGVDYAEKIIRPEIRSAIRAVIAHYDAKAVYSDKREEIAQAITALLQETIGPRGIAIERVLLRNVTLPANLAKSIQEKLQAEQESQRYDFLLEREKKEAQRKRIEAEGQRDAQNIINASLTPRYLQYLYIKELKDRKGTIYVPTNPANGMPLFRGL